MTLNRHRSSAPAIEQLLTAKDVAQACKVGIQTIRNKVKEGKLKPVAGEVSAKGYRFTRREVERFIYGDHRPQYKRGA